ncbi:MAG: hypothetical protein ACN0LA_01530 [Candidatus Longimicrobiales bacterium M2_2A_002]
MRPINEELHRWLDGELEDHELSPELRDEAERWRELLAARPEPGPPPPWLEQRIMGNLPAHRPGWLRRVIDWISRPRTLEVRPVTIAAGAVAVLALVLLFPDGPAPGPQSGMNGVQAGARGADGTAYVQFLYVAPEAETVTVAGDFNDWSEQGFGLEDPDGDGIWTGEAPLSPGLHKYMFVVDGEWVTDPQADRYVDDGFGNRNALIEVPASGGAI